MMSSLLLRSLMACSMGVVLMMVSTSAQAEEPPKKLLRHVVLFKFKEDVSQDKIQEVVDAFRALPAKIDAIEDFEYGTDVGVENLDHGFTHGFLVTFRDAAGRDEYLPHPAHQEFVKLVKPTLDKVQVFDYWVQK